MAAFSEEATLRLCVITDEEVVATALQASLGAPHELVVYPLDGVVGERNTLAEQGQRLVQAALSADAVLFDWRLEQAPVLNTLCFHIRRSAQTPLVAICRGNPDEQVAALAAGADDALTFPVYPMLIRAHVVAYRRLVEAAQLAAPVAAEEREAVLLQAGNLHLDRQARRVFVQDEELELTFREFALLGYLLDHLGEACTRDQILDDVWGIQFDTGTNMVDVYVYFLRRKLAAHGFGGEIQTVRGYGYRLDVPETTESKRVGE